MLLGNDLDDLQISYSYGIVSHVARHASTFDHALRPYSSDGSRLPLGMFLSVRARTSFKSMPLHHALKSFALGHAGHGDLFAFFKYGNVDLVAALELRRIYTKFFHHARDADIFH